MITIQETKDYKLVNSILSSPKLSKVTAYSGKPDKSYRYLVIKQNDTVVGIFNIRPLTSEVMEVHINIHPTFWGVCDLSKQSSIAGFNWVKENTKAKKCFTEIPVPCANVHGLCKKLGWKACGMIDGGSLYDGEPTDLLLYQYDLYGKV